MVNICRGRGLKRAAQVISVAAVALVAFAPQTLAQRTQLKPGWNMFSPQQDIEVGKRASADARRQLASCNSPRVDEYLTQLGKRLAAKLPTGGVQYPWEFHCVNDKAVNAFALPGGYVFVNRGAIEIADNEAQLAGVMAHELSHVALRHGTNQATKAEMAQGILGMAGAIFGDSTGGAMLTSLGTFAAGGVLLRYSRSAESQADVMGTQVLYDSGYDPRALPQFFEKLEVESKGKTPPEFFSDHPSPEHRVERVDEEIQKLGGVPANARRDSPEFEAIKREVLALPVMKKGVPGGGGVASVAPPSSKFTSYEGKWFALKYPENWGVSTDEAGGASFAPQGAVLQGGAGGSVAYGLLVGVRKAEGQPDDADALAQATQQLIGGLRQANPNMKVTRQSSRVRLNGQRGLSTYLSNDSPAGGQETDWLISVLGPGGLLYFLCVAPEAAYADYDKTFSTILDSVRLTR
jgi:Zn-dependent protease with chaperone function